MLVKITLTREKRTLLAALDAGRNMPPGIFRFERPGGRSKSVKPIEGEGTTIQIV
jgi:hypothetical protein